MKVVEFYNILNYANIHQICFPLNNSAQLCLLTLRIFCLIRFQFLQKRKQTGAEAGNIEASCEISTRYTRRRKIDTMFYILITTFLFVSLEELASVRAVTLAPNTMKSNTFLGESSVSLLNKRNGIQEPSTNGSYVYEFVNQSFGVLTSPLYPMPYPSNGSSRWRITMAEGQRIVLIIRQFILEPGDELRLSNDRINKIYTADSSPDELSFLSTNKVDITLTSSSNLLNMTDGDETHKQRLFYAMFEREGCGGNINRSHGYINVPLYIHGMKRPHECIWTIETMQDKVLTLEFIDFDLAPGSCIYNNIYVRDGDWSGGYMLGQFCEENPPFSKLRTVTNTMTITYRMRPNLYEIRKQYQQIPYIKMFFRAVDNCGGDLEGYSGTFDAPVGWHNGKSTCRWRIRVPESKIILLKIKDWNVRPHSTSDETLNEHVQVSTTHGGDSIIWDSFGVDTAPDSLLIPSNQGIVSLSAISAITKPYLHFRMNYEAVLPLTLGECFSIADKEFFMCHDETYIDCQKRCDGVSQCETGNDEADCPTIGVRRSFGPKSQNDAVDTGEEDNINLNAKPHVSQRYALLWLTVMVVSAIGIGSVVLLDQLLKKSKPGHTNETTITNIQQPPPPPYKEFEDEPSSSVAVGAGEQRGYSSPTLSPPYHPGVSYGGGDEVNFPSLERNSEFISRTFSTPSILHETSSLSCDGSSESIHRPRYHSTPFGAPFYSSTSTLGSSESITRGSGGIRNFRGSTDGSTESIPTDRRNCSQQIAALFHDTDVIESTSTTIATPVQCFRFSDSMESHEEFLQQIRVFREPEV